MLRLPLRTRSRATDLSIVSARARAAAAHPARCTTRPSIGRRSTTASGPRATPPAPSTRPRIAVDRARRARRGRPGSRASTRTCCGAASASAATSKSALRKSTGSASPWWFMTPPTLLRQRRHARRCARARPPRARPRSAARTALPPTSKASEPLADAPALTTAPPRRPVRKRRIAPAQLAARRSRSAFADATISPIASSWRRAGRGHLVDRGGVRARHLRDLVHRLDHALGVARLRVGLLEDLLGAAPRPRRPRRGSARARCAIVFTSSRPSAITLPDSRISSATLARVGLDLVDQLRDLVGAARRALGELADLVGDDREAAARLAGARRLDRGVQREQVRARARRS